MPLRVGGAYSLYELRAPGLQETVGSITASLQGLREQSNTFAKEIEQQNARVAESFKGLQGGLGGLRLPEGIVGPQAVQQAAAAATDLRKTVEGEVGKLGQSITANNPFRPLTLQAAEAARQVKAQIDTLQREIQAKKEAFGAIGFSREDLRRLVPGGQARDAIEVPYNEAPSAERDNPAYQRPFGRVASTITGTARFENAQENAPAGTQLNLTTDVEQMKALAEQAYALDQSILQLERNLAEMNAQTATRGLAELGEVVRNVTQAEDAHTAAVQRAAQAQRTLEQASARLGQYEQRLPSALDRLGPVAADANDPRQQAAQQALVDIERQGEVLVEAERRAREQSIAAVKEEQAALDVLKGSQQQYNELIAAARQARGAASPSAAENGGQDILAQDVVAARQREQALQREAEMQRQLHRDQLLHAQDVERLNIQGVQRVQEAALQSETIKYTAAAANVAKIHEAEQKVEQERLKGANAVAEQEARAQRELTLKQTEDVTKITQAQIDAAAKIEAANVKAASAAALQQNRFDRQDAQASARGAVADDRSGFTAELGIAKAQSDYAQALQVVQQRLQATGLSEREYNGLLVEQERLMARLSTEGQRGGGVFGGMFGQLGDLQSFSREFLAMTGYASAAMIAFQGFQSTMQTVKESFNLSAEIDLDRRELGALVGSVQLANRDFESAIDFGRQYARTQQEMARSAQEAAPILRTTTQDAATVFDVMGRLAARVPGKDVGDAVRAITELQAGQLQTIERVFNIPQQAAQQLKREVDAGKDPIVAVDALLNSLGMTSDVLKQQTEGAAGAINRLKQSTVDLKVASGDYLTGPGAGMLDFFSNFLHLSASVLNGLNAIQSKVAGMKVPTSGLDALLFLYERTGALSAENVKGIDNLRAALEKVQPPTGLDLAADQLTKLDNRLGAGQIGLNKYDEALRQIGQQQGIQPGGATDFIKSLDQIDNYDDKIQATQTYISRLKREIDTPTTTDLVKQQDMANLLQLDAELSKLMRASPVEITVEMQTQQLQDASKILDEVRGKIEQTASGLATLDQNHAKRMRDLGTDAGGIVPNQVNDVLDAQASRTQQLGEQGQKQLDDFIRGNTERLQNYVDQVARINRDFRAAGGDILKGFDNLSTSGVGRAQRDFAQQILQGDRDFNQQMSRQADDFHRSTIRGDRDFNDQMAHQASAFRTSEANAAEQFRQENAKAEEAHTNRLADIQQRLGDDLTRIQRETTQKRQQEQQRYDVERARSLEDEQDKEFGLAAQGKTAELIVARYQFQRDQARKAQDLERAQAQTVSQGAEQAGDARQRAGQDVERENRDFKRANDDRKANFDRQRADALAAYNQQRQDAIDARNKQKIDAQADFERAREQAIASRNQQKLDALAAYNQARQDAIAAHQQQLEDARTSYTQAKAAAKANFDQQTADRQQAQRDELADYNTQHAKLLSDLDQFIKDEKAKYDQSQKDILSIEELKRQGVSDNEAAAIIKMQDSLKQYQDIVNQQLPIFHDSGLDAGLQWVTGFSKGMLAGVQQGLPGASYYNQPNPNYNRGVAQPGSVAGNPANDPRVNQNALANLFGPNARETSTYDDPRQPGQGVSQGPGQPDLHGGVDITITQGSPVPCPVDLQVTKVFHDQFANGTTVMGIDPLGRQWLFAHLYRVRVQPGQVIRKGATLGYIGAEGHVHVQLRQHNDNATPIDPTAALNDAGAGLAPILSSPIGGIPGASPSGGTGVGAKSYSPTDYVMQGYSPTSYNAPRMPLMPVLPAAMPAPPPTARAAQQRVPLNVYFTADVKLNGDVIGRIAEQKAVEVMLDDFEAAASVDSASRSIPLQSPVFRSAI